MRIFLHKLYSKWNLVMDEHIGKSERKNLSEAFQRSTKWEKEVYNAWNYFFKVMEAKCVYNFSIFHISISYTIFSVVVQSLSHVQLFATPDCSTLDFPVLHHPQSLLKLISFELVILSNHLILCRPFSSCPQYFPASKSSPVSHMRI